MRVLYVCTDPGVPIFGDKGGSTHVREVVRAMLRRGAQVEIVARRIGGEPPADLARVPVHRLTKAPSREDPAARERFLLEANEELRRILASLGTADMIYERHALWTHAAMEYARDAGICGVLEVNAPLVEEQRRYRDLVHEAEAIEARRRCLEAADGVLAVSRPLARWLETLAPGKVHEVCNGVDTDRFRPDVAPSLSHPAGVVSIGFVGSLRPWHGVPTLVEAFASVHEVRPHVRLVLVGDGPAREEIVRQIDAYGLRECVHLCGKVAPEAIPGLLTSMDIATAPYPDLEGFYFSPLKLFEYMSAGRAIVASSCGQIPEVIEHERTGLLVEPGDVNALAAALMRLVDDEILRGCLGAAARHAAVRAHRWDAVAERILSFAQTADTRGGR